jgi:hypothetical protein
MNPGDGTSVFTTFNLMLGFEKNSKTVELAGFS